MEKKSAFYMLQKDLLLKQIQYMELYRHNFTTTKTTYDFYFYRRQTEKHRCKHRLHKKACVCVCVCVRVVKNL